ncbi:PAS and ANTAR domain-containing protein [Nakamurella sp. PAMC28650]|uniref:PAS and ANTAR domain-containing protein n=1 Tax=Nakamurella sp. PAMC28650 TaxID=2762325 RepID=UPI00164D5F37|nr:PAS and ANTAR domain-containing protein [Nakamurella sp. PAMC28650]QNK79936.1 PAS and ANTAR domain-containing protein [Nakamurella sp. PAMC28650]
MTQSIPTTLAGGVEEPAGDYTYDVPADRWWWSDEVYLMHGFTPGQVVPTTALLLSHKHPDDRDRAAAVLAAAIAGSGQYCCRHRIIDARRRVHTVVSLGHAVVDQETGKVIRIVGNFVDLTRSEYMNVAGAVQQALDGAAESRAVIEQAKGALMITHGFSADEAFVLLRHTSQQKNIKIRELATMLVDSFSGRGTGGRTAAQMIAASLAEPQGQVEP